VQGVSFPEREYDRAAEQFEKKIELGENGEME
jgi:hypothetical protein